jgi:S-adenosylmethionine hydrolase
MPIVLLSDFGGSDSYVGVLKGVLARLAPHSSVIDLVHDLPPFDLLQANLVLYQAYRFFPEKSIFVAVVDPEVGGKRKPLLIETEHYFFVGPDNGVFTLPLSEQKIKNIFHLDRENFFLKPISATFHGRDIYAPVAAHLSAGVAPSELGSQLPDYFRLPDLEARVSGDSLMGKILGIDRFGNAITNFKRSLVQRHFPEMSFSLEVGEGKHIASLLRDLHHHYAEGRPHEILMLFGGSDLLEISVNQGSAAEKLNLRVGDPVKIPLARQR